MGTTFKLEVMPGEEVKSIGFPIFPSLTRDAAIADAQRMAVKIGGSVLVRRHDEDGTSRVIGVAKTSTRTNGQTVPVWTWTVECRDCGGAGKVVRMYQREPMSCSGCAGKGWRET